MAVCSRPAGNYTTFGVFRWDNYTQLANFWTQKLGEDNIKPYGTAFD